MVKKARSIHGYTLYTSMVARTADLLSVIAGAFFAYYLRFGNFDLPERYVWAITLGVVISAIVFPSLRIYQSWRGKVHAMLMLRLLIAHLALGSLLAISAFFTKKGVDFSRLWVFGWIILGASLSIFFRLISYPVLNRLRARGKNRRGVLLIGDPHSCSIAIEHLSRIPSAGFDVRRVILVGTENYNGFGDCSIEKYVPGKLIEHNEEEVWICLPVSMGNVVRQVQECLSLSTSNIRYMPSMHDFRLINHSISNVADLYLLDLSCSPMTGWNQFLKAVEDRVIAAAILILISPILLVLAVGVKLSSPGPIFYRQERVGWNGKPFNMVKFRSMPVDVEKNGVQWGGAKSKNVTRFGSFLRRTSLDELPQFFNVINGDMSIVGPRPERTIFVNQFKHEIPGYMQKHMVKAGITGWAQINGWRGDTDLSKRIECDLWYIENWSLLLDVKIIVLTVFKGLVSKYAY